MRAIIVLAAIAILSGCQSQPNTQYASPQQQQLHTVNQLLTVRSVDQLSPKQWRFTVKYKGNRPIGELDFVGELYQGKQLLTQVSAQPQVRFKPGSNYYIVAEAQTEIPMGTAITSYELHTRRVQIY